MALRAWVLRAGIVTGVLVSLGAPVRAFEGLDGDLPLTRRDLLAALYPLVKRMEAQGAIAPSQSPSITTYADLAGQERDWAVELSGRFHLFAGVPALTSGRFNASLPVSRWEAAVVLGALLYRTHPDAVKQLPRSEPRDFADLTPAEAHRLEPVVAPGLFIGFPDQTFRTQEPLTKAQWERVSAQLGPLGKYQAPASAPRKSTSLKDDYQLLNLVHPK